MNYNTTGFGFHEDIFELGETVQHNRLDVIAYDLAVVLMDGIYEFAVYPAKTLSRLHKLLHGQYKQKRESECANTIRILCGTLGFEYDAVTKILRDNTDSRSYFLYAFIAELSELLEERSDA